MQSLYEFVSGPMVWIAFLTCIAGTVARLVLFYNLSKKKDKVIYKNFQSGWAAASVFRYLAPLNITARTYPVVTLMGFIFHGCLLVAALFLSAHVLMLERALGISWVVLPDAVADGLTLAVIAAGLFFAGRRILEPTVRILSDGSDWLAWALAMAPFVTGFLAYHQIGDYMTMVVLHIIAGNVMLAALPFTRLSHAFMFFVSRMVTGSDFGKRDVGAW